MITPVITVSSRTPVTEVENILRSRKIDATPVVDNGELTGIVANLDVARLDPNKYSETRACDIMTQELIIAYPDETLYDAMRKMTQNGISHLPVVNRHQPRRLIGILTINDVMSHHTTEVEKIFD